jgi:hypothetical protein
MLAASIAVMGLAISGCSSDKATMPTTTVGRITSTTVNTAEVVRQFADGIRRAAPIIDATQATCLAQHVVDSLGAEHVAELGFSQVGKGSPVPTVLEAAMIAAYPACLPPEILAALGNQVPSTTTTSA